ncbi:MAG: FG-GAP repeat domain-containing protein, partial [Planctomycetota bacterium]
IDLIVVRKEPFTTEGRRTNVLLLNENGVLVDRTAELAAASDVPGDSGFLTPTNDRDVELVDLTGDGLPEIVTAPEQVTGQPKWISHPRVYLNLGLVDGAWQGFRHEDARFPQLFHNESGIPLDPRFMAVASGDLNGDGHADLYFGDHDTGTTLFGALQPASEDTDDRVLYNDGNGFFTDVSTSAMTPTMLASTFCNSVEIGDFNDDGAADVLKQITYSPPLAVRIAYGDTANPGAFGVQTSVSPKSPYFVESGDRAPRGQRTRRRDVPGLLQLEHADRGPRRRRMERSPHRRRGPRGEHLLTRPPPALLPQPWRHDRRGRRGAA